jgi:hypothetical protein
VKDKYKMTDDMAPITAAAADLASGWTNFTMAMIFKSIALHQKDKVKLRALILASEKMYKDGLKQDLKDQDLPSAFLRQLGAARNGQPLAKK